jgi:hypothetical protein
MSTEIRYRGRVYTEREIDDIKEVIAKNPDASRFFLSKELCRLWNWTQANGTPRDMICWFSCIKRRSSFLRDGPGSAINFVAGDDLGLVVIATGMPITCVRAFRHHDGK